MASLIMDFISRIYAEYVGANLILFNMLSFIELLFFSLFFYQSLDSRRFSIIAFCIGATYVLIEFLLIYNDSWQTFQSYSKAIVAFLLVGLALISILSQILQEKEVEDKSIKYGVIFYFSMEFILLLPMNYLINAKSEYVVFLWATRLVVIFVFYLIIIHYLWSLGRTKKLLPSG